jgi:hypothetical protein
MLTPDEEFDKRLRVSLEPTPETVNRVKAAALRAEPRPRVRTTRYALAGLLALLVVVATVGFWRRERPALQPDVFTAEFSGDLLVIRAADGSVTVLGRPSAAPSSPAGGFQIVYEGGNR